MKKYNKIVLYAVLILLLLGCFFRLGNLNVKPYWGDEVYTSIRIFGYTRSEIVPSVADGRIFSVEDLQKFQQPDPERGVSATINSLIAEDAEITPLYFSLARVWAHFFGSSVAVTRLLPSLCSLLSLPCIYWLCLELFESSTVGWGAVSLTLISPLNVVYAQEARHYSLWVLTTLLSCVYFLKAIRTHRPLDWITYGFTVSLSLYACILAGVVVIAHGTYILITTRFRQTKVIFAYLLSTLLGFLTFTPWLFVLLASDEAVNRAEDLTFSYDYISIAKHWAGMLSRLFLDFNFTSADEPIKQTTSVIIVLTLLILLLTVYSIYFLIRNTPQKVWLFVLLLLLAIPIVLIPKSISPDFPIRYVLPSFLAIQLAVAYTLSTKITSFKHSRLKKIWQAVLVLVVLSGAISCTLYTLSDSWWNKYYNESNHQVAEIINQEQNTLVVSDLDGGRFEGSLSNVMSLSYLLNPARVKLRMAVKEQVLQIPKQFDHVFILTPSSALLQSLKKSNYTIVPVYKGRVPYRDSNIYLWKVTNATLNDSNRVN